LQGEIEKKVVLEEDTHMTVNLSSTERVARVILGVGLIAFAAITFGATEVFVYRALCVAFGLLGADMLVTGVIGFCPLYYKLGRKSLATLPHQPQ
jgi:hypothetical protein